MEPVVMVVQVLLMLTMVVLLVVEVQGLTVVQVVPVETVVQEVLVAQEVHHSKPTQQLVLLLFLIIKMLSLVDQVGTEALVV